MNRHSFALKKPSALSLGASFILAGLLSLSGCENKESVSASEIENFFLDNDAYQLKAVLPTAAYWPNVECGYYFGFHDEKPSEETNVWGDYPLTKPQCNQYADELSVLYSTYNFDVPSKIIKSEAFWDKFRDINFMDKLDELRRVEGRYDPCPARSQDNFPDDLKFDYIPNDGPECL